MFILIYKNPKKDIILLKPHKGTGPKARYKMVGLQHSCVVTKKESPKQQQKKISKCLNGIFKALKLRQRNYSILLSFAYPEMSMQYVAIVGSMCSSTISLKQVTAPFMSLAIAYACIRLQKKKFQKKDKV